MAKITQEIIDQRVNASTDFWKARNDAFDEFQSIAFLEGFQADSSVEGVQTVINPEPQMFVKMMVGLLSSRLPQIRFLPADETDEAKKKAATQESVCTGLLVTNNYIQESSLVRLLSWCGVVLGWLCAKTVYNANNIEGQIPFLIQNINPKFIYPKFGRLGLIYAVEKYERTVGDVADEWPKFADKLGTNPDQTGDYVEYWDREIKYVKFAGEELLKPTAHAYGFIPYSFGFAERTPVEDKDQVDKVGLSMLYGIKKLWAQQNKLMSAAATFIHSYVNDSWKYITEEGKPYPGGKPKPGSIIPLRTGDEFLPINRANVPPDVSALLKEYQRMSEMALLPGTAYGISMNQSTGYAITMLTQGAVIKTIEIQEAIEQVLEKSFSNLVKLIQKFGGANQYKLWGVSGRDKSKFAMTFTAEDFDPDPMIQVSLQAVQEQEKMQRYNRAFQAKQSGLLSDYTILDEILEFPNPDLEETRKLKQQMIQEIPEVKQAYGQKIIQESGDPILIQAYNEFIAKTKAPPPPMEAPPQEPPPGPPPGYPPQGSPPQFQGPPPGPLVDQFGNPIPSGEQMPGAGIFPENLPPVMQGLPGSSYQPSQQEFIDNLLRQQGGGLPR